ncbi:hypothetical protein F511_07666 [Dorcoceras hygrometricum]|uniref:Arabinogalactan peptide 23-like n=1 Tax=Dorcoceras hygrometricum TaxID=472368 RepID=A0A2Z7CKF9_9LAMI|nr:hypothetical protein F511_07666 [Dorcoceras hygrometricum]
MDMKKIACLAIIAAAAASICTAKEESHIAAAAPAPSVLHSGAIAALPMVGSLVGASLLSLFALFT